MQVLRYLWILQFVHPLTYRQSLILVGISKVNLADGCLQSMLLLLVAITPAMGTASANSKEDFHEGQTCSNPSEGKPSLHVAMDFYLLSRQF